MAEFKTTVALEVGAQSVTMGVFTPSGKGFSLSRYARRDILLDPVEEGMRMDYVSNAISEMVTELKVKGSEVRNVVSGQQVFMRFIKLPALDMDDIGEQVGYEAQQHIPFPLEDIIYSYQVLGERDGEREVLLVAIKKDVLDDMNTQVEGSGLRTVSVDCSITSLYNAFRASYPDETSPVMLLDIGAKTTDIIFSEDGRFFTRSVTAAGSFITNSIAREFNMSYREAEKFKIEHGQVSMGNGHTDSMTEQEAALATTIRTAMQRLGSEVQRTINHYRMQYKGNPPVKAYVCGGGARLPYVVDFLQGVLNIPVEYMNPLAAFSIGPKVDVEALEMDMLTMGSVAGAAVTGAKVGEFNIDLVPTSVGKNRAELEMIPKVIAGGLVALAGAGFYAYAASSAASHAEADYNKAKPAIEAVKRLDSEIKGLQADYDEAVARMDEYGTLMVRRSAYSDVLKQISEQGASLKFWFAEFSPLVDYSVDSNYTISKGIRGTHLINLAATGESAINKPDTSSDADPVEQHAVTAIYLRGYSYFDPVNGKKDDAKNIIRTFASNLLIGAKDGEPKSASGLDLFTRSEDVDMDRHLGCYVDFTEPSEKNKDIPDYAVEFKLVLPLKQPILVPELPVEEK